MWTHATRHSTEDVHPQTWRTPLHVPYFHDTLPSVPVHRTPSPPCLKAVLRHQCEQPAQAHRRTGAQALPRSHHHRCPLCRLPYATGAWCCGTAALSLPKLTVCALAIHGTVSASPGSSHLGARTWEPHQVPWEPQLEASTAAWARPHARALTRAHPRALTRAHARAPRRRVAHCSNRLTASGGGRTSGAHDARPQGHGTGHSSGQSSRPGRGCSGSSSTRRGRSRGGPTNWRSTGC